MTLKPLLAIFTKQQWMFKKYSVSLKFYKSCEDSPWILSLNLIKISNQLFLIKKCKYNELSYEYFNNGTSCKS